MFNCLRLTHIEHGKLSFNGIDFMLLPVSFNIRDNLPIIKLKIMI